MGWLRIGVLALIGSTLGCGSTGTKTDAEETGEDTQASESAAEEGFPDPDECQSSEDCLGEHCVAAWTGEPPRGPAVCVSECVEELDLQRFCIDDAACCENLKCSIDGLCEPPWTGDGDGDPTGDGDGDGDGDLTGDGDGDGDLTGDGDGDGDLTGDGDGDGDGG